VGPWALAVLDAFGARHRDVSGTVTDFRVQPALVTARVDGREVALSASPITRGIWAAVGKVTAAQSEQFAQQLEHTWEEPLVPRQVTRLGRDDDVAAVAHAFAEAIERDPSALLRWRGYGATADDASEDPWRGGELPELPPPARRPPESVPKRFGASGIQTPDGDLVEVLVRAYRAFAD